MDASGFDRLAKSLAASGTRRGLLQLLTALPLGVTLSSILGTEPDTAAKDDDHGSSGRRRRRKAKHRHQTGNDKDNRKGERKGKDKGCNPESRAKTCAGTCGTVRNNCGKRVDCGSCACTPPCPVCQTCNAGSGQCQTDATQIGQKCGAQATCDNGTATPRGTCSNGTCQPSSPVACIPYKCNGTACATSCNNDDDCVGDAFCSGVGQCVGDNANGESCQHGGQCQSGHCVGNVCCATACTPATCENGQGTPAGTCTGGTCQPGSPSPCEPYTCAGDVCGTTCGDDDDCVDGAFCNDESHCVNDKAIGEPCGGSGQCLSGHCVDGFCCNEECFDVCKACNLDGNKGTCTVAPNLTACGSGQVCCAGACKLGNDCSCAPACAECFACQDGACVQAPNDSPCGTVGQHRCCEGQCECLITSNAAQTPFCKVSPSGGTCCCTKATQICEDVTGGTTCANP